MYMDFKFVSSESKRKACEKEISRRPEKAFLMEMSGSIPRLAKGRSHLPLLANTITVL
jgi:hypothetical protein